MGARRVAKAIGEQLLEFAMEMVGETILTLLAYLLLGTLLWVAYLAWAVNPRLAVAGATLAGITFTHGAWVTLHGRPKGTRRRGVAAVTTGFFALASGVTLFLALYATGCDC
ncbi:hypothetical protein ACIQZN_21835 [Streptomyces sp. NPDC097595]|uniref:hypothetical protein n=1 Tax=Streptomyces sp. NPDC097595 TaxID=3366090 RepID=UPI00381C6A6E